MITVILKSTGTESHEANKIPTLKNFEFGVIMLTPHFEATRALFWDGPHSFEPRSDDEDDTSAGTLSPSFRTTPVGRRLHPYI
ncbi:hypothetical protein AVEN_93829-1 [Araneus ventricosus]|uniref:Uncharacterized protein n=1 Tax=Araneus ventricosus TaxID=182803 RepID=A0A4Y2AYB8_ARAVE|nr:hypothetical protein AVEN_93829-1 [Araneus ventricosus]